MLFVVMLLFRRKTKQNRERQQSQTSQANSPHCDNNFSFIFHPHELQIFPVVLMFPYNVSKLGDTSFLGLNLEFFSGQSTLLGWGSGFTYLFSPLIPPFNS